jgi:hypothetical protein
LLLFLGGAGAAVLAAAPALVVAGRIMLGENIATFAIPSPEKFRYSQ